MRQTWGRVETAGRWPHPPPVWTMVALIAALLAAGAVQTYTCLHSWTSLQRWYLSAYLRSGLIAGLGFTGAGQYRLLHVVDYTGSRLALDDEITPAPSRAGMPFQLTDGAVLAGDRALVWQDARYRHPALHAFLNHWIYRDQPLTDLVQAALWSGVVVFGVGGAIAVPMDVVRARARRHGRRLKGPELVSVAQFNRRFRSDGVGFRQTRARGRTRWICVPRAIESSHVLIMGDSGTGKSALIRQLLAQLEARGETAIVYDPALEYTGQFYRPDRGDVILNPLDARSPFWSPGDEWRHEAETLTLATSLFPDRHHENTFFTEGPRRIFAHLLTMRPTPEDLGFWLCHEDELDRRLKGTAYAAMIDRQAPAQRSGVLASLNMVADTLQLLPAECDTTRRWSAAAWATSRTGWLFLTSTPETRPRLVPLTSLWLDALVLRLMNQGQAHPRRTWFILDELASLQRLPQLHTAITENRKSNNPVVLGFQGRSQLETRYGHDAEAMLSQPATKIFLRTTEPRAAQWIAQAIGEIEIERLRESRSHGRDGRQTFGLERQVEPLVMASEISGLPALRGYLKLGNLVVRLSVPFVHRPQIEAAFIERPRRRKVATPMPDATPAAPAASQEPGIQPSHRLHQDYELK
jgi:type IV secretory pathway TraG/TraD family ATPase VirD4